MDYTKLVSMLRDTVQITRIQNCYAAADAIESLQRKVAELEAQRDAANAAQDVRNQALEEAARICSQWTTRSVFAEPCMAEIRALKTAAPSDGGV